MELIETRLETRVNDAFMRVALELLPKEVREHDLTGWLLNTLNSAKADTPEAFPTLSFEVNWKAVVACATRNSLHFNAQFYFTTLFRIGRVWRVSELAAEAAEKALEPRNLAQTVLANIESYRHVLEEMNIAPDDQHTFLSDSIREIVSLSQSQHVVRINNAKRLWLVWKSEVQELKTVADQCSDEFLCNLNQGQGLTSIPQVVHDVIRFSFADKGIINAL